MTAHELLAALRKAGVSATRYRISYAILTGKVSRPPQDGTGNFHYKKRHMDEFVSYFQQPHKRGKRSAADGGNS